MFWIVQTSSWKIDININFDIKPLWLDIASAFSMRDHQKMKWLYNKYATYNNFLTVSFYQFQILKQKFWKYWSFLLFQIFFLSFHFFSWKQVINNFICKKRQVLRLWDQMYQNINILLLNEENFCAPNFIKYIFTRFF